MCLYQIMVLPYPGYVWVSFLSWTSMHFWQPDKKKDTGNVTGAVVEDMILGQDFTKLLLVFYICFPLIVYLGKKPPNKTNNRKATLKFNNLCLYSAWDTDCWCKQYKCPVSALFFIWTSASHWQKELISNRYKSYCLLNQT